jgi:hypothetical protein
LNIRNAKNLLPLFLLLGCTDPAINGTWTHPIPAEYGGFPIQLAFFGASEDDPDRGTCTVTLPGGISTPCFYTTNADPDEEDMPDSGTFVIDEYEDADCAGKPGEYRYSIPLEEDVMTLVKISEECTDLSGLGLPGVGRDALAEGEWERVGKSPSLEMSLLVDESPTP